jgi:hypothetical protein
VKLTRERKLYVALLAAGVVALIGDRLFFAPSGAGAAVVSQDPSSDAPAAAPKAAKPAPEVSAAPSGPSFSQRISDAAKSVPPSGRDAFRPGATWPRPHVNDPAESTPHDTFETFLQKQQLTMVMLNKDKPFARINKEIWQIGDVHDSYTLVAMDEKGVEFESPSGERRRLDLPVPKLQQQRHEPPTEGR